MRIELAALAFLILGTSCQRGEWHVSYLEGLDYPRLSVSARERGTVVIECQLSSHGEVSSVTAVAREGPVSKHGQLVKAALANASRWRFRRVGRTRESTIKLVYEFKLEGVCEYGGCPSTFSFEHPNRIVVADKYRPLSR